MTASATCGCYECQHKLYHGKDPEPECPLCNIEGEEGRNNE